MDMIEVLESEELLDTPENDYRDKLMTNSRKATCDDTPLTEEQRQAYEAFAGKVLCYLDDIKHSTGYDFGMATRHMINLKFNHMIRKEVYPGGFNSAVQHMVTDALIHIREIKGKAVVMDAPTQLLINSSGTYEGDPCREAYSNAWGAVVKLSE